MQASIPPSSAVTSMAAQSKVGQSANRQPNQPNAKKGGIGCAGLVVVFFIAFWISDYAGCKWTQSQSGSGSAAMSNPTKAQWTEKVRPYWSPNGPYAVMTVANFKSIVGEPSQTQTIGSEDFWYYECSDGTVQVKLISPNLTGGQVAIQSINYY